MFTKKFLEECFLYRPDGRLTWKQRPYSHFKEEHVCDSWNTKYCGKQAGESGSMQINDHNYRTAHIVWAINSGRWPVGRIFRVKGGFDEIHNLKMMGGSRINKTTVFKQLSWHEPLRQWRLEKRINGNLVQPIYYGALSDAARLYDL